MVGITAYQSTIEVNSFAGNPKKILILNFFD